MDLAGRLVRRECVTCPSEPPTCNCGKGEVCTLTVKTCTQCPEARCISDGSSSSKMSSSSASAIAGGVVGGLVGLGIIIGLIFWTKFRHRRKRHLQDLNEVALEFDTASQSPEIDSSTPEIKPPSIISTYGGASRRSNVIPILFPLAADSQSQYDQPLQGTDSHLEAAHLGNPAHYNGSKYTLHPEDPVIRDSIRDSEYSFQSDNRQNMSNQGLRAYDIAVQGLPSLVDMSKQKPASRPTTLHRISELEVASVASTDESMVSRKPPMLSRGPSRSRQSHRNSFAALPELPAGQRQDRQHLTKVRPSKPDTDGVSPFDDSASVDGSRQKASARQSLASSNQYVAELPEEAELYQGHGLL